LNSSTIKSWHDFTLAGSFRGFTSIVATARIIAIVTVESSSLKELAIIKSKDLLIAKTELVHRFHRSLSLLLLGEAQLFIL